LYASRSGIPATKTLSFSMAKKQVCIYAFSEELLKDFVGQKEKTALENIEDIEILRFLELGHVVQMVEVSTESMAVDTPSDVKKVKNLLAEGM